MASLWPLYALRITTAIRAALGVLTGRGPRKQTAARRRLCLVWRAHGEACHTPPRPPGVLAAAGESVPARAASAVASVLRGAKGSVGRPANRACFLAGIDVAASARVPQRGCRRACSPVQHGPADQSRPCRFSCMHVRLTACRQRITLQRQRRPRSSSRPRPATPCSI